MKILKKHGLKLVFGSLLASLLLLFIFFLFSMLISVVMIDSATNTNPFTFQFDPYISEDVDIETTLLIEQKFVDEQVFLMFLGILFYLASMAFFSIGLTSSVYQAVFHDQSKFEHFITLGAENLWRSIKLTLTTFLVTIPLMAISIGFTYFLLSMDMVAVYMIFQFILLVIVLAFHNFTYLIALDQKLSTWKAMRAGLSIFTKCLSTTLTTTFIALITSSVIILSPFLFLITIIELSSISIYIEIIVAILLVFVLPIITCLGLTIYQIYITICYKKKMKQILYPDRTPAFITPF